MLASTDSEPDGGPMSSSVAETDRIQEIAAKEAGAEETREFRIFGPP